MPNKKKFTSADFSLLLVNTMLTIWPTMIAAIMSIYIRISCLNSDFYTIACTILAFIVGASFTGGSILISLPKDNKYMLHLEKTEALGKFIFAILLPCLLGIISLLMILFLEQIPNFQHGGAVYFGSLIFFSCVFQFIWSVLLMYMILFNARHSK